LEGSWPDRTRIRDRLGKESLALYLAVAKSGCLQIGHPLNTASCLLHRRGTGERRGSGLLRWVNSRPRSVPVLALPYFSRFCPWSNLLRAALATATCTSGTVSYSTYTRTSTCTHTCTTTADCEKRAHARMYHQRMASVHAPPSPQRQRRRRRAARRRRRRRPVHRQVHLRDQRQQPASSRCRHGSGSGRAPGAVRLAPSGRFVPKSAALTNQRLWVVVDKSAAED
jgi:hypothetical protein